MSTKTTNTTDVSDLTNQMEILRRDLGSLTQTMADLGRAKGEQAAAAVKSKAYDARDVASEKAELARLQAAQLHDQANDFIRSQPATALGIAAGLGFLVGYLGSRK